MSLMRLMDLQVGLHTDVNDFTSTPGTLRRIQLMGGADSLLARPQMALNRNDMASRDGRGFLDLYGPIGLDPCSPSTEFKGVSANTGAAVTATGWLDKLEQGELLVSMLGADFVATASAAPTVAAAGHTTTTLVCVGTAPVAGQAVLFQTSAGPVVRFVISVATLTATLDRAYSGTPTNASTVIRGAVIPWSPSVVNHRHLYFKAEMPDALVEFFGASPVSWGLTIPNGGKLQSAWVFAPSNVVGPAAPVSPTPTPAAAGTPAVGINTELWIGSERFLVDDLSVAYANGNEDRGSPGTPAGKLGGLAGEKRGAFTISATVRNETRSREGVQRATGTENLTTLLGTASGSGVLSTSRDVLLVVGRAAGAAIALRMPDANVTGAMAQLGTHLSAAVTLTATQTASLAVF